MRAQLVENPPAMEETWLNSWVGKIRWRRDRLPTPVFLGFLCGSAGKEFTCNSGEVCSISGLGRSPGEGKGYPLQYFGLENSMEVAKSQTWLSGFHFTWLYNNFRWRGLWSSSALSGVWLPVSNWHHLLCVGSALWTPIVRQSHYPLLPKDIRVENMVLYKLLYINFSLAGADRNTRVSSWCFVFTLQQFCH